MASTVFFSDGNADITAHLMGNGDTVECNIYDFYGQDQCSMFVWGKIVCFFDDNDSLEDYILLDIEYSDVPF